MNSMWHAYGQERLVRAFLPLSVFISGAVVMVLEILGTRLVGSVYGTSLYVWSALIGITLFSLSLGYWIGGCLADRVPQPWLFFLIFDVAALLLILVPLIRASVFGLTRPLGLRSGVLASSALFLIAPLTLLGMTSPFAVRLAAKTLGTVGKTAGGLYAVSTAGSLLGILVTGFYLIPQFRVRTILFGAAAFLVLPALVYQLAAVCRRVIVSLLVIGVLVLSAARPLVGSSRILAVRDTPYSQIKVVDYGQHRALLLNGAYQTIALAGTSTSIASYPLVMADLAWRAAPLGKRALVIGLGGGILPSLFSSFGVATRVVEIDAAVLELAERYFAFDPTRVEVTIADGRQFLASTAERYDYIFLDAYAAEVVPAHMLTEEMMRIVATHLNPGGVMVLNYSGYRSGKEARALRSVTLTISTHLPWTVVIPCCQPGTYGNNIIVAGREPVSLHSGRPPFPIPAQVSGELRNLAPMPLVGPAVLLTDDYNPLDLWSMEAHETFRRIELGITPWDVMLAE